MRKCACGKQIPYKVKINGRLRNLQNRTQCLACLPFGESPYRPKDPAHERSRCARKQKAYYYRFKNQHEKGYGPTTCRRKRRKNLILALFNKKCQICNYNRCTVNLSFHHLNTKQLGLDEAKWGRTAQSITREITKCVLICHNCHGEVHQHLISTNVLNKAHNRTLKTIGPYLNKSWVDIQKHSRDSSSVGLRALA